MNTQIVARDKKRKHQRLPFWGQAVFDHLTAQLLQFQTLRQPG